jgi:sporulation related protein
VSIDRADGWDTRWDRDLARTYGTWALRLDGLVPAGWSLSVDVDGEVQLCRDERSGGSPVCRGSSTPWDGRSLHALFAQVKALAGSHETAARAALGRELRPYMVQIAAGSDGASAARFAERANALEGVPLGYYEAGGFPAINAFAHVEEGRDPRGAPIFRVTFGAYASESDARAAASALATRLGTPTFIREV